MAVINITVPNCAGCCDPCGLPDTVSATIADLESCGCRASGSDSVLFDSPTSLNGTFSGIDKVPDFVEGYTIWRKNLGEVGYTFHLGNTDCSGDGEPATSYWTLFIICDGEGNLTLQILGLQSGYPETPFDEFTLLGGFSAPIENTGEETANDLQCDDGVSYLAGGTGQIDIP